MTKQPTGDTDSPTLAATKTILTMLLKMFSFTATAAAASVL